MKIEAQKFTLEMSHDELWATAFDIRRSLEHTLMTHWINHQDSWKTNEAERLNRIRLMFAHLGRLDLYEDIFIKAKDIFEAHNGKNFKTE